MLAHVTMNYAKPQLIYAPGCSLNAALGERGGGGGPVAMGGHGVCVCVCVGRGNCMAYKSLSLNEPGSK
jgi:hypothetical protein